jgi:hypothetical protein
MKFNYQDRIFVGVSNTENGEVSGDTKFHYRQNGDVVWATYEGGSIIFGTLIAKVLSDGRLDMRYQHLNEDGEFLTGKCISKPEVLSDGRYRLHESWQWTCGAFSEGSSIVEEIESK